MTADRFTELLHELGKVFELSLHTDKYNACSIQIDPLIIQLQLDSTQERIFMFCKVIELPPGKFRENVLKEALKANGQPEPRPGIFGYIAASNHLSMYQRYPLSILNGERLAGLFGGFFDFGKTWHEAIQHGQSGPITSGRGAPFGLRP